MNEFSPEDMRGFERVAIEPYLKIETFMRKEEWSYSTKTTIYVRTAESANLRWACGLMCVQFRTGVTAFKAELWECYEGDNGAGEGIKGLDERWDIGVAVFPNGVTEDTIADILGYVAESEASMAEPVEFLDRLHKLEALFKKFITAHEKPFPELENESANFAVQAMIDS